MQVVKATPTWARVSLHTGGPQLTFECSMVSRPTPGNTKLKFCVGTPISKVSPSERFRARELAAKEIALARNGGK